VVGIRFAYRALGSESSGTSTACAANRFSIRSARPRTLGTSPVPTVRLPDDEAAAGDAARSPAPTLRSATLDPVLYAYLAAAAAEVRDSGMMRVWLDDDLWAIREDNLN
jgi:hypothetical protein